MKRNIIVIILSLITITIYSQEIRQDSLNEVIVTSSRIDLPFSKNSRTIQIIDTEIIEKSTATNVADLLQEVAGIDVRRRGIDGMQSDLYIRGGQFNQTLILIDGIKTEDPQTGHHTMNSAIPLENIERIEIIKGPAARIFGQNAFNGAINIVTKKRTKDQIVLSANAGSFHRQAYGITLETNLKNSNHQLHYSTTLSEGYRENTDFENRNYFLKSNIYTKGNPIQLLASFGERKFGANNFYTNSPNFNEYEETQTSLVGISTKFKNNNIVFKPNFYWKRNQDMFLLKREDPSFSRNFNISNKIGTAMNASYTSNIGITGFGIDISQTTLDSNNLGDQDRTMISAFLEHRFSLLDDQLDVTPGLSFNYFSDFDFQVLPGIDVGYRINDHVKFYGNVGYSYRVPTYTELYINIPNFLSGNDNLEPEKALAEEIGFKVKRDHISLDVAFFNRDAENLIDYIKETEESPLFVAQNLRKINTKGYEVSASYDIELLNFKQQLNFGYTFLEDDYKDTNVFASRYLINTSIKHHFTTSFRTQFFKNITQSVSYKYVERPLNSYSVVDTKITVKLKSFKLFVLANNIFNTEYSEKNNVPMPKGNMVFGVQYKFK